MKLENMAKNGLLELAKSTSDSSTLSDLATSCNTLVRRAVARNKYSSKETLMLLSNDPVMNVSYMACQNGNFTFIEFSDSNHPCVRCDKDEREMICNNCSTLNSFYKN